MVCTKYGRRFKIETPQWRELSMKEIDVRATVNEGEIRDHLAVVRQCNTDHRPLNAVG